MFIATFHNQCNNYLTLFWSTFGYREHMCFKVKLVRLYKYSRKKRVEYNLRYNVQYIGTIKVAQTYNISFDSNSLYIAFY